MGSYSKDSQVRGFKFLYVLALLAIVAATLSSCSKNQPTAAAENSSFANARIPDSRTMAGGYLAGRFAQRQQDWDAAQKYMGAVLDHDQDNSLLAQRTFVLALGSGNFTRARELAGKISAAQDNSEL